MKTNRSRWLNFSRGLATGYVLLGVNIFYTAVSVPLGLQFLGREQFGVWALAQQISGYFWLLDLGMSAAVSRLIAEKKSDVSGNDYRSLVWTGGLVLLLQGVAIALLGGVFARYAPELFSVPEDLADRFSTTLLILSLVSGLSLAQRSLGLPLWAFQRMDVINFSTAASLLLALATMWAGLEAGLGIYSLALAGLPGVLATACTSYRVCHRNHYYPTRKLGRCFSWGHFRSCFDFGKDVFAVGLGTQLVNASQVMIISRFLGLESAAIFSVATKIYYLAQQICSKIVQSSISGLTEIFVQGNRALFGKRVLDLFIIIIACAGWAACALILLNRQVILFWTSGNIAFTEAGDVFLGFLLIPAAMTPLAIEAFIAMGFLKSIRFLRIAEGTLIFLGSLLLAGAGGTSGILAVCLVVGCLGLLFSVAKLNQAVPGTGRAIASLLVKILGLLFFVSFCRVLVSAVGIQGFLQILFLFSALLGATAWIFFFVIPAPFRNELYHLQKTLLRRRGRAS